MARELDFSDSFESSVAPTVGFIAATGLQVFADDAAFVTAKGSAAVEGDAYHNSTTDQIRYYDGAAWREVVSGSGAQTIAGAKTFSNDVVVQGDLTVNGTTTTLNTSTMDVEDPQITVNKNGNQATANATKSGFKVEMSDATHAVLGYDSTLASKFKAGESGSEVEIVTVSHSQSLSNKTIDGDVNTVQDLPLTALKTNLTDASKFIVRDASGIPVSNTKAVPGGDVVGTSDAQVITGKDIDGGTASNTNRITLPKDTTANLNGLTRKQGTIVFDTTTNAPKYDDGSALQSFGGGAGGGLTPTATKTANYTAVSGDLVLCDASGGAFNVTLPTATNGHYVAVKKSNGDSSFNAITIIGTIDGVSNTTINTFGETIYLVANGTEWKVTYRHIPSVWTAFTPTGSFNTAVTYTGSWKREGANLRQRVLMSFSGNPNSVNCDVNLVSGLTIDSTPFLATTSNRTPLDSTGTFFDGAGGTTPYQAKAVYNTSSNVYIHYLAATGSFAYNANFTDTSPYSIASGDFVLIEFTAPISGWKG